MCEFCHQYECPPRCPSYVPPKEIKAHCPICNEPIFEGDEIYKLPDGTMYHDECFYDEYHTEA